VIFRNDLRRLKQTLTRVFSEIKDEFDEHRETINQNTNEIQANYEYLCRLDAKIDKLGERIDELTMCMQPETVKYNIKHLTTREKEVFLALYAAEEAEGYKDIARKIGLNENLVICYISNLISKGVPINKRYAGSEVMLSLDAQFKEHQMKENIIGINETLSKNIAV